MEELRQNFSMEDIAHLLRLTEQAFHARSFEELSESLSVVSRIAGSPSAFLFLSDPRLTTPFLFHHGFQMDPGQNMQGMCCEELKRISGQTGRQPINVGASTAWKAIANLLYPLRAEENCVGMLGLTLCEEDSSEKAAVGEELSRILSKAVDRPADQSKMERQLAYLNTYLTVSSMLAQPLGLNELLETILYAYIEVTSAEEASILLLDEDKKNFFFYQIEGPSKPILKGATFPADRGIAGSVLQTQRSEIINDVQNDPRFYGKIDSESGFKTNNMIAIPLTAGEERIGVLEVLNRLGGQSFSMEEHHILLSIAEEIAFAIRNASVFEYVVDSYCKQRQGLNTCKGCKRPLGSWTPCVKYRETQV